MVRAPDQPPGNRLRAGSRVSLRENEGAMDEPFALDDYYLPAVAHGWRDADWAILNRVWSLRL